ncbi:MAG: type ISP restriction/modification enzyme [Promethearchaeota archaeon]
MNNVVIPQKILTPKKLAFWMAHLTKKFKEEILLRFEKENKKDPLHQSFFLLKKQLINDLVPDKFADIYAQAIVYGYFSTRVAQEYGFSVENILKILPDTDVPLKNLFEDITKINKRESITPKLKLAYLNELNELINKDNIKNIIKEFKNNENAEDPIIHFYELFLKEYAANQRFEKGVFYTPEPVVSFTIRSVDQLIKTEMNCPDGLADTSTIVNQFKKGQEQIPKVQILDPATGTGTFLKCVIKKIKETFDKKQTGLKKKELAEKWNDFIINNLLPRIFGFELMPIPYLVAHLRLGLELSKTGYDFKSNNGFGIYLTNTLKGIQEGTQLKNSHLNWLTDEKNKAYRIKSKNQISVVIGNPPYSGFPANKGEWITKLVRDYYYVDGKRLEEKNPKWLLDDYVKFIRFGQWCINKTEYGILAFITNHGYLDNPTFRGMRENLMKEFPLIYICNLHGNSIKNEISPDGSKDECVFDIKQGVCIAFFIKPIHKVAQRRVFYLDIWGLRDYKLNWLNNNSIETIDWKELKPVSPFYLFVPQKKELWEEYKEGLKLTDIFKIYSAGIATARDHFTIQWTKDGLLKILRDFVKLTPEDARKKYNLRKDVRDWKVKFAQKDVIESNIDLNLIVPILYRPFDIRYTYYTGKSRGFLCMPRPEVMKNMLTVNNIGISVSRSVRGAPWRDVFASKFITEFGLIATRPGNTAPLFPLFLYEKQENKILRKSNLTNEVISIFSKKLGLKFADKERNNINNTLNSEDIFHYIYAILHSQKFRKRYAEFLKIDFPYIPITNNIEFFKQLTILGADLIALHTLNSNSPLLKELVHFVEGSNGKQMGKFSKDCYTNGKIFIDLNKKRDGSYFDGIPENVWNFYIGSYQVCFKWLYDKRAKLGKKGKPLTVNDVDCFKKIVIAINETIRIMKEIDYLIEEYGGWPLK